MAAGLDGHGGANHHGRNHRADELQGQGIGGEMLVNKPAGRDAQKQSQDKDRRVGLAVFGWRHVRGFLLGLG